MTEDMLERSVSAEVGLVMIVARRVHSFYIECTIADGTSHYFFCRVTTASNSQSDHLSTYSPRKVVLGADGRQPGYIYLGTEGVVVACDDVEYVRRSGRNFSDQ